MINLVEKEYFRGLAIDRRHMDLYLSMFKLGRIDVIDLISGDVKRSLTNISKPAELRIDHQNRFLFIITNSTCIYKYHMDEEYMRMVVCTKQPIKSLSIESSSHLIYWITSDGTIFRCDYNGSQIQLVIENNERKLTPFSLYISNRSNRLTAYISDHKHQMIMSIVMDLNVTTTGFTVKRNFTQVLMVEYPSIYSLNVYNEEVCSAASQLIDSSTSNISVINETRVQIATQESKLEILSYNLIIYVVAGMFLILVISLLIFGLNRHHRCLFKKSGHDDGICGKSLLDPPATVKTKANNTLTICIEDLGGFNNSSYLDNCSECPLKKSCEGCDYEDECLERGICMSSYRLLNKI